MADGYRSEQDRRPYAKTSRRRACDGRRRQKPGGQHLVRDRGRHAGAVDLLGLDRRRHPDAAAQPRRQFLDDPHRRRRRCWRWRSTLGYAVIAAVGVPLLMLMLAAIAGNMIQHRLVWSGESLKPKFSKISPGAGFKRIFGKQAVGEFRQGPVQADRARRRHDGGAVAGAPSAGGVGALRPRGDPGRDHRPDAASDGRGGGHAGRWSRSPIISSSTGSGTSGRRCRCRR